VSIPAWDDLEVLFHDALERRPADRAAFLAERCAGRPNLQAEVEALLRAHDEAAGALEVPPAPQQERLTAGDRLGPYEVLSALGAGCMGEVYRAHDTKLNRDVALKILPEAFVLDANRVARFEREAQVLASLNHPNIAAIYGFEESLGMQALVLELVEGPTLADRIARGPVPLNQALQIARRIADALEAAHEQGIVHRDLKPANIKVGDEGTVKVLDFGLAKALNPEWVAGDLTQPPTITSLDVMSGVGPLLGTAAYMSPEQAEGRPADKRSDVWAFGCVLYEMLTGKRAFVGMDVRHTLMAVLTREPEWKVLPADTPIQITKLLRRCLQKEHKRRLDSAVAARLEIDDALTTPVADSSPVVPAARRLERLAWTTAVAAVIVVAGGIGIFLFVRAGPEPVLVSRFTVMLPPGQRLAGLDMTAIAFSPDGKCLAYVATAGGLRQLYLREMDSFEGRPLAGTEGAVSPFFSSDGQSLGFFTVDSLKTVPISGGPAKPLARVDEFGRGGSWASDGSIVFASGLGAGLTLVSAAGGALQSLTTADSRKDEGSHRFPHHLPGGRALLFTVGTRGSWDDARIEVLQLGTGERKTLIEGGSDARYVPTGHLVYLRAGTLMAVPFDLNRLQVTGTAVPLVQGVLRNSTGAAQATLADTGSLLYVPGTRPISERTFVWVDRTGKEQPLPLRPQAYLHPRLSPDGQRVALDIDQGNRQDPWIYDLSRGGLDRLTERGGSPVWTSDGEKVTFASSRPGAPNLFWKPADGSGIEERLTTSENRQISGSWSPNGETLAFTEVDPATGMDIWTLSLNDARKSKPFLRTQYNEANAAFSPDGHWVAYQSNESGGDEVYVRPFPGPGGKVPISIRGGTEPVWSRDGHELFYLSGDKMMAVATVSQPSFLPSKPEALFEKPYWTDADPSRNYDVTTDGHRFLTVKESEQIAAANQVNVVLNWFEELKRRVPTK
jgi:eukaryotic-like serine/threonine-protein kinase